MAGVLAAYSWWATSLRPFSAAGAAAVTAAGAAAMSLGARRPRPETTAGSHGRQHLPWALLFVATCVWEIAAYLQHPRHQHPTLSSLANDALASHPARAAAFAAWVAGAFVLARR